MRLGGEEFLVICRQETTQTQAMGVGERLRQAVQQRQSDGQPPVTVSIGVAMRRPSETWESQLKRADDALYQAKSRGRNRVERA